ncbi:MAG: ABC transporter ATP-binding protein [Rhodospirillales bacterium]|nr:ABC transporter ATP-binding protein [Rhodospirillales bacterium]
MRRELEGAEIRLHGVSRAWGTTHAVQEISLTVPAGSFTVLLGPSGCGKTTCLRLVAGLETVTAGRIEIGGRDVTHLPPAARGVAMVFQSYALFPHLSVAENILFGLRARRVPAADRARRLDRAVDILGIAALLGRRPGQLSGGQQQRVALGRAIVAEAPVCLMDEPLSNLDAQLRADMRREILALQRRLGLTMLYVTHDQTEAMSMADQVVLMRAGRIEQQGPPATLYGDPATRFVAGFIGTPPMNLFPLQRTGDGLMIPGTEGPALLPAPDGGGTLVGGLRPEHIELADRGIPALVQHAEYLGADTILSCRAGEATLLVRLPGQAAHPVGSPVHLRPTAPIALFDPETGARRRPLPPGGASRDAASPDHPDADEKVFA